MSSDLDSSHSVRDDVCLVAAGVADATALLEYVRAYHAFERIQSNDEARRQALHALLSDPSRGGIWFIVAADERVGYLALTTSFSIEFGGADAFIDELFLVEAARGQRVGDAAMARVLELARLRGLRGLHLQVAVDNAPACHLYRRHGLEERSGYIMLTRRLP